MQARYLALVLLLASLSPAAAQVDPDDDTMWGDTSFVLYTTPPRPGEWAVGLRTFGPFRFGTTQAEAEAAYGHQLALQAPDQPWPDACATAELPGQYASLLFTWDGQTWVLRTATVAGWKEYAGRYVVESSGRPRTWSGVGVGSTKESLREAYPSHLRRVSHTYEDTVQEWFVFTPREASDRAFSMTFKMVDVGDIVVAEVVAGFDRWASGFEACQ